MTPTSLDDTMSFDDTMSLDDAIAAAQARLSSILVTVTVLTPDGDEISRVATSHPDVYPIGGRKRLDPEQTSPLWLKQVVHDQRPFVGATRAQVRAFFFDWATIESLGCAAIINTPVVHLGATIASINFLGPEGSIGETQVGIAEEITCDVTDAVLTARLTAFPELAS